MSVRGDQSARESAIRTGMDFPAGTFDFSA
jgi:hypothetical protein